MAVSSGTGLRAHDRYEGHAPPRLASEVVGQCQLAAGFEAGDAALLGSLAPELEPALEHHPQTRSADGVTERLEAAIRVHRQLAVEIERAGQHLLPTEATVREAEVL